MVRRLAIDVNQFGIGKRINETFEIEFIRNRFTLKLTRFVVNVIRPI